MKKILYVIPLFILTILPLNSKGQSTEQKEIDYHALCDEINDSKEPTSVKMQRFEQALRADKDYFEAVQLTYQISNGVFEQSTNYLTNSTLNKRAVVTPFSSSRLGDINSPLYKSYANKKNNGTFLQVSNYNNLSIDKFHNPITNTPGKSVTGLQIAFDTEKPSNRFKFLEDDQRYQLYAYKLIDDNSFFCKTSANTYKTSRLRNKLGFKTDDTYKNAVDDYKLNELERINNLEKIAKKSCDEFEAVFKCAIAPDQKSSLNSIHDIVNYSLNNSIDNYTDSRSGTIVINKFCECKSPQKKTTEEFESEKLKFKQALKQDIKKWEIYTQLQKVKDYKEKLSYFIATDVTFSPPTKCQPAQFVNEIKNQCPQQLSLVNKALQELEGIKGQNSINDQLKMMLAQSMNYERAPFCQGDKKLSRLEYDLQREQFSKGSLPLNMFNELFHDIISSRGLESANISDDDLKSIDEEHRPGIILKRIIELNGATRNLIFQKLQALLSNPLTPKTIKTLLSPLKYETLNTDMENARIAGILTSLYQTARIDDPRFDLFFNDTNFLKSINKKILNPDPLNAYSGAAKSASAVNLFFNDQNHHAHFENQCNKLKEEIISSVCNDIDLTTVQASQALIHDVYSGDKSSVHFKNFLCENNSAFTNEHKKKLIFHPSQLSLSQTPDNYILNSPKRDPLTPVSSEIGYIATKTRLNSAIDTICNDQDIRNTAFKNSQKIVKKKVDTDKVDSKIKENYLTNITSEENIEDGLSREQRRSTDSSLVSIATMNAKSIDLESRQLAKRMEAQVDHAAIGIKKDIDNYSNKDKKVLKITSEEALITNSLNTKDGLEMIDKMNAKKTTAFSPTVNRTIASVPKEDTKEDVAIDHIVNRYGKKDISKKDLDNKTDRDFFTSLLDQYKKNDDNSNEDKLLGEINQLKDMLNKREGELDDLKDQISDKNDNPANATVVNNTPNLDNNSSDLSFGSGSTTSQGYSNSISNPSQPTKEEGAGKTLSNRGSAGSSYANINQNLSSYTAPNNTQSNKISLQGVNFDNYDLNNKIILNEVKTIINKLYIESPEKVFEAYSDGLIEIELADGKKVKIDPNVIFTSAQLDDLKKKQKAYYSLQQKKKSVKEIRSKLYSKLVLLAGKLKENGTLK